MAVYHLSVKTISRSAGRSGTGAAAYRAGVEIYDERTGDTHDYTRKSGVEYSEIILPAGAPEWAADRAALWNAAEQSEKRKNSTVAREFEIALPSELSPDERKRLAVDFAKEIVERHGCVADVSIHAPGKGGDSNNHHAHILCSTRKLEPEGFTDKTRELDERTSGEVDRWRERFAELQNERLHENGIHERVDHRSLKDQGIDREPTQHLGVAATGYERRTGQASDKRLAFEREAAERLARAKELGELEREAKEIESSIIDLSGNLSQAKAERDRQQQEEVQAFVNRPEPAEKEPEKLSEREKVNQAFHELAKANLRQEESHTPAKPETSRVELAEQTKAAFFEEAKESWRTATVSRYSKDVEETKKQYWELRKEEPKEPLLFKKKEWEFQHGRWVDKVNGLAADAKRIEKMTADVRDGKYDTDRSNTLLWDRKAQERLETERPELAKALKDYQTAELQKAALARAKAAKEREVDKAISTFKSHAIKREGKALGYGDSSKKWNAMPQELRDMIDGYNKQPKEARPVILEKIRGNMKRSPDSVDKFTKLLEQGNERSQSRGMER